MWILRKTKAAPLICHFWLFNWGRWLKTAIYNKVIFSPVPTDTPHEQQPFIREKWLGNCTVIPISWPKILNKSDYVQYKILKKININFDAYTGRFECLLQTKCHIKIQRLILWVFFSPIFRILLTICKSHNEHIVFIVHYTIHKKERVKSIVVVCI